MNLLTINAGSSSIKYKVFSNNTAIISGLIEGIGESKSKWHHSNGAKRIAIQHFQNHEQAFNALGEKLKLELQNLPIQGVGHRVVHGGDRYHKPTIITAEVLANIIALSKLAPIHNPINALGIEFALNQFPDALQVAIFDNGFHHTMPEYARTYAVNAELANKYQIRRYGFHGINHEYVAKQAAIFLNKELTETNLISLHLGNGASACLIKNGLSIDTSMGLTPLAGLVMGTRCGDIDPAIVLYLQEQGLTPAEVDNILNKQSGLKGIADENDMRKLISRALANDKAAIFAIDIYVYAIQKMIGAYYSQLHPLDALIFTGGVGENASFIREKIIAPLAHLNLRIDEKLNLKSSDELCYSISKSGIPILVIRGDEEALMAEKLAQLCL
ncbi:MAG: acetate kinase [Tatlockia sp.]|nr:acetate kinase [Tatlockia sp.]